MQSFSGRSNVKERNACPSDVGMNGGRCAGPSVPNIISYIIMWYFMFPLPTVWSALFSEMIYS